MKVSHYVIFSILFTIFLDPNINILLRTMFSLSCCTQCLTLSLHVLSQNKTLSKSINGKHCRYYFPGLIDIFV
jgi:hypothetical protein